MNKHFELRNRYGKLTISEKFYFVIILLIFLISIAARMSLAWEIGNGIGSRFSVQLSDTLPQFKEMWAKNKYSDRAMSNNLDDTIYVGDMHKLRFIVAANMTMNEGDTLHYRLRVSLVPSNIDVWGWVKYYREPYEASQQTTQSTPTKAPPKPPKVSFILLQYLISSL